jgi:ferredoxin/flavodoxin---NADP+ reductase
MFAIRSKDLLTHGVWSMVVEASYIARSARAGQFVILRARDEGERIPLTIADSDPAAGTITLVFQEVGKSTMLLGAMSAGQALPDLVGPLGIPTHVEKLGLVVCVGGGIGIAPIHPIARAFRDAGSQVVSILGARSRDLLIMEEEMRRVSTAVRVCTDDGTYGEKGFVTQLLQGMIDAGTAIDLVMAVGPVPMMEAVAKTTRAYAIRTMVSLNSIMVDGTGMCGACRATVGGRTVFVCVDGPEFDAHQVDFGELRMRQRMYLAEEREAIDALSYDGKG